MYSCMVTDWCLIPRTDTSQYSHRQSACGKSSQNFTGRQSTKGLTPGCPDRESLIRWATSSPRSVTGTPRVKLDESKGGSILGLDMLERATGFGNELTPQFPLVSVACHAQSSRILPSSHPRTTTIPLARLPITRNLCTSGQRAEVNHD